MNPQRAVIYARVSTDEQAKKGHSLPSQLESCRGYAKQKGFEIVGEFTDDISGTKLDRPGLDAVRDLIRIQPIDALVVHDLDRLTRKAGHYHILEEEFNRRKTQVHYVLGQYADSAEGRLMKGISAELAEFEREKIRERAVRGKMARAKAGLYVGVSQSPYGYSRVKEGNIIRLVIKDDEAKIVRIIFNWYVFGDENGSPLTYYMIANKLAKMGIPSPSVGKRGYEKRKTTPRSHWNNNMISRVINNETYAGVWHYYKQDYAAARDGGKKKTRPHDEWIPVSTPAIIDRALWNSAQERTKHNRHRTRPKPQNPYLMQSRLFCAYCGKRFTGYLANWRGNSHWHPYYVCPGTKSEVVMQFHELKCTNRNVRADFVDAKAWEFVTSLLEHPEQLLVGMREKQVEQKRTHEILIERLQIVDDKLSELRVTLSNLIDRYVDASSQITRDLFAEKQRSVTKQVTELEIERRETQKRMDSSIINDDTMQTVKSFASLVRLGLANATFEDKRRFIEMLDVRGQLKRIGKNESLLELTCILSNVSVSAMLRAFARDKEQADDSNSCSSLSLHRK